MLDSEVKYESPKVVSKKQESVTIFDTLLEANYLPMLKDSKYTSYISGSNISKMSG